MVETLIGLIVIAIILLAVNFCDKIAPIIMVGILIYATISFAYVLGNTIMGAF